MAFPAGYVFLGADNLVSDYIHQLVKASIKVHTLRHQNMKDHKKSGTCASAAYYSQITVVFFHSLAIKYSTNKTE